MRIPSQFNEDSLYRQRGKKRTGDDSFRRLIRLSLALLLVVVAMQQAGQPAFYAVFFPEDSEQIAVGTDTPKQNRSLSGLPNRPNHIASNQISDSDFEAARVITQRLGVNDQRQWLVVLSKWQGGSDIEVIEPMVSVTRNMIAKTTNLSETERSKWQNTLQRFGDLYASPDRIPPDSGIELSPESSLERSSSDADSASADEKNANPGILDEGDRHRLNAWIETLDKAAMDRVVDASVWRSEDIDAFYLKLDQAKFLKPQGAVGVAVVPLMQQSEAYLGSKVRIQGRVGRSEKKKAAANLFGITDYWELWVLPSDGGDRPFVLIASSVPEKVAAVGTEQASGRGPEIQFVGTFFKRLAYASNYGADAAPVVIGRLFGSSARSSPASVPRAVKRTSARAPNSFWLALAMAIALGVTVAGLVMWRTTQSAKRSRKVREQHRKSPEAFLDKLRENPSPKPSGNSDPNDSSNPSDQSPIQF